MLGKKPGFIKRFPQIPNPLEKNNQIDILFIQGIEYSLYQYELKNFGQITEKEYHNYKNVPRILNHLNQQRERFRDDFPFSLVFILPSFALRYFLIRAGDFFDWRSTILELPKTPEEVETEISRLLLEGYYQKYLEMTQEARVEKILYMQELLAEGDKEKRASLFFELGNLLAAHQEYKSSVISYDKATQIKPDKHEAWNNRGNALFDLKEYEQAIKSYDKAIQIKPDKHEAWNNRGNALLDLNEYEQAIKSYEQALQVKPDVYEAWYNRGNALLDLNEYEQAIKSYEQALQVKPDVYEAWYNRGNALFDLNEYEQAIKSYEQALQVKPDDHESWYNKACCYALQGNIELSLENLQQAINLNTEYQEIAKTDSDFDSIRHEERFRNLLNK